MSKKRLFLQNSFMRGARKILKTKTEKGSVDRALEIVIEESEILKAHAGIAGAGHVEKVYR